MCAYGLLVGRSNVVMPTLNAAVSWHGLAVRFASGWAAANVNVCVRSVALSITPCQSCCVYMGSHPLNSLLCHASTMMSSITCLASHNRWDCMPT